VTLNSPYRYLRAEALVRESDIVISVEPHTSYTSQLAKICKRLDTPLVITSESSRTLVTSQFPPYKIRAQRNISMASALVACTRRSELYLRSMSYDQSRVRLCPLSAVDPEEFAPAEVEANPESRFRVLFVGRLEEAKGLATALQAVDLLSRKLSVELTVVGRGKLEPLLRHNWRFPLRCLPFLGADEYPEVFRNADVLCMPSKTIRHLGVTLWEEVFGVVAYEAMAAGLPIVVSDSGNLPDAAGSLNPIVRGPTVDGLFQALRGLAMAPSLRKEIGAANRQKSLTNFGREGLARRWGTALQVARPPFN